MRNVDVEAVMVRKLQLIAQDEVARSAREGSLDRTTQVTGQHCRDGFYDQDEIARSVREGGERSRERAREAGPRLWLGLGEMAGRE